MPPRAAKIVPVILPILLASAAFASESSLSTDSCLAAPKGAAPEGSHWYYRIDRTTKRHCWHLGDAQPKSPPQKSSDAAVAESAPAEQSRIAPAVADARAELVFSKAEAIVSSAAVTELQQVASASPEALPAAGSPVSLAADLRRQVAEMLNAGKSDDDVRNYMVARYGNFILFRPPVSAKTIWVWATPGILLLIGAAVAVRITKQRAALVDQDNEPVEEDIRSS